jgi:hypothetical protein
VCCWISSRTMAEQQRRWSSAWEVSAIMAGGVVEGKRAG